MNIIGIKTPIFEEGASLEDFIDKNLPPLRDGYIVVVTSKIVALSESRVGERKDKERLIAKESKRTIRTPWALLTLLSDGWAINAGIDESNAKDQLILLPKDPFRTAGVLQKSLRKRYSLKKLGILITDTRTTPLRAGTIGRALGYAGFEPMKSYIGKKDLFGRKSRLTESNLADALAGAAVALMGEGSEQTPLAIIRGAPVIFVQKPPTKGSRSLAFPPEKDIFSYLFKAAGHESRTPSKKSPLDRRRRSNP